MKILVLASLCAAMLPPVPATSDQGADRSAVQLVEAAQQAMAAERYQDALALYDRAASLLPEAAEIPYNMGVAAYRQGDLARAAELFNQAQLLARDPSMQARTAYNLGTASAGQAMQSQAQDPAVAQGQLQGATETLQSALKHFREAIAADPLDQDARANGELAWKWLQELQEQMQQQEQQNQEQDQQQQSDQQQQQDSQQERDEQQRGDEQQQQGEQQQQDQQQQDGQQQEQPTPSEAGNQRQQDQPDERQASAERRPMNREEAERLLQGVRDKEARRREELARIQAAGSSPVDKDW